MVQGIEQHDIQLNNTTYILYMNKHYTHQQYTLRLHKHISWDPR